MKKVIFFSILFIGLLGCIKNYAQGIPVYPIPSSDIYVNGIADFRESQSDSPLQTEGKRVINVEIKTPLGRGDESSQARIWVYCLDNTTVLGPYMVESSEPLSVLIDGREWGVLVATDDELIVSVWIDSQDK